MNTWKKRFVAGCVGILLLTAGQTASATTDEPLLAEFEQVNKAREASLAQADSQLQQLAETGAESNAVMDQINLASEYTLKEAQVQGARSLSEFTALVDQNMTSSPGHDLDQVMEQMQQMSQAMREITRSARQADMQEQASALSRAAEQIRQDAAERLQEAIISSNRQIAEGLITIGPSIVQPGSGPRSSRINIGDQVSLSSQTRNEQFAETAAEARERLGMEARINQDDMSREHELAVENANDMMQQMQDIIRDVRDKLAAIDQARNETNRGIARNI